MKTSATRGECRTGSDDNGTPVLLRFLTALHAGDMETVDALIPELAREDIRLIPAVNLLLRAVRNGRADLAGCLLRLGARPDAATPRGITALMIAAERGDRAMVRLLAEWKADPLLRDEAGRDVFQHAAAEFRPVLEEILHIKDSSTKTTAASGRGGSLAAADCASRACPFQGSERSSQLHCAGACGDIGSAGRLHSPGIDCHAGGAQGLTAFMMAVERGDIGMARRLIVGADLTEADAQGRTPLMMAAERDDWDMVRMFVAWRPGMKNGMNFFPYVGSKHWPAFEKLLEQAERAGRFTRGDACFIGPQWNAELLRAAARGDTDSVNYLLDLGADINARDAQGRTPLMIAAAAGHAGTVRHLLVHGYSIYVRRGSSAAARMGDTIASTDASRTFGLSSWSGASLRDADGNTAFALACRNNRAEVVALLEEFGISEQVPRDMQSHASTCLHVQA